MASIRFFVEGSAEHVAAELTGDAVRRRAHRRLAAVAYERHRIDFEEMIDGEAFTATHDDALFYVLGETWTAALAEVCGAGAVGGVFRALGRDAAPEDLDGLALWQDTVRAMGCQLERVVARWGEDMAALVGAEQAFLAALPRLGGGAVGVAEGQLVFRIGLDRPAPAATLYLRVRRHPGVAEEEISTFTGTLGDEGTGVELRIPGSWAEGSLEYQLGQAIPGSLWPFYEEWQTVTFGRR